MSFITDKRRIKFEKVAAQRQLMTVILENVHDPHNIGAVLRTCDAVGIDEVFVLYTDDRYQFDKLGHLRSSATGVKKWMQVHCFRDIESCFSEVRSRYDKILATHLNEDATSMYDNDLTDRVAFLFGNEHDGLSQETLNYADGNIIIPQHGMVQSLNISVACAVTVYEAQRQRWVKGLYKSEIEESDAWRKSILKRYIDRHDESYKRSK